LFFIALLFDTAHIIDALEESQQRFEELSDFIGRLVEPVLAEYLADAHYA
jgi:DNA-binding HxlR family transcriptional regulator